MIHQLPTYIFSNPKQRENRAFSSPEYAASSLLWGLICMLISIACSCLICRASFCVGEEIKSLPCFHTYHSDCIDAWLRVNKVCPVCQCAIDCMHPGS